MAILCSLCLFLFESSESGWPSAPVNTDRLMHMISSRTRISCFSIVTVSLWRKCGSQSNSCFYSGSLWALPLYDCICCCKSQSFQARMLKKTPEPTRSFCQFSSLLITVLWKSEPRHTHTHSHINLVLNRPKWMFLDLGRKPEETLARLLVFLGVKPSIFMLWA